MVTMILHTSVGPVNTYIGWVGVVNILHIREIVGRHLQRGVALSYLSLCHIYRER